MVHLCPFLLDYMITIDNIKYYGWLIGVFIWTYQLYYEGPKKQLIFEMIDTVGEQLEKIFQGGKWSYESFINPKDRNIYNISDNQEITKEKFENL